MNPYFILGAVGAMVISFGAGYKVCNDGWLAKDRELLALQYETLQKKIQTANEISERTEKKIQSIRVVNKTINNEVQREVSTNTVYRDCNITDNGLRIWNSANKGSIEAGKLDSALSEGITFGHGNKLGRTPTESR